jgi:hypothetical protein
MSNKMKTLALVLMVIVCGSVQQLQANENTSDPHLSSFLDLLVNPETFGPDIINSLYDIEQKSSNSDKIYVALIDYHLGAGGTECLDELITKRGKRVLPLLKTMQGEPIACEPKYEARCIKSIEHRNAHISELINAVNRGIVLCPDYENCPKVQK